MTLTETLAKISLLNRDDGYYFTDTSRLDAISRCLEDSRYSRANKEGLFHLYTPKPLDSLNEPVVVISSHADCADSITRCFSELLPDGLMRGTFDNAITNAALLNLMLEGKLPGNVLAAFTGDEEKYSRGAADLMAFADKEGLRIRYIIVLDVTDMGWQEEADFTIENNFWRRLFGKSVAETAEASGYEWMFAASDPDRIPSYIDRKHLLPFKAEADESWEYDEHEAECFSLCLPVLGNMHSDEGVYARKKSFERYTDILSRISIIGGELA